MTGNKKLMIAISILSCAIIAIGLGFAVWAFTIKAG